MTDTSFNNKKTNTLYLNFKQLFEAAKAKDEFEYCCALLRIQGMEGPGWDTLQESYTLLTQIISLVKTPIESSFRTRLLLLAYCHSVEMDFIYDITANMLQISQGERYCTDYFDPETRTKRGEQVSPSKKIQKIQEFAKLANQEEIGNFFSDMYLRKVRNAFDHSDYILFKNLFRIKNGNRYSSDLFQKSEELKLEDLLPKLELGINFAILLIQLTIKGIRSYKENKIVPSRMLEGDKFCDMELTVDPTFGLIGFRSVIKKNT